MNTTFYHTLDARRKKLGMSCAVLARISGVSLPTVVRILSGKSPTAAFANVLAIIKALGMHLTLEESDSTNLLEAQARKKAATLIGLVQGTSGLEGQAVDKKSLERMRRQTALELLAGSKRILWSE